MHQTRQYSTPQTEHSPPKPARRRRDPHPTTGVRTRTRLHVPIQLRRVRQVGRVPDVRTTGTGNVTPQPEAVIETANPRASSAADVVLPTPLPGGSRSETVSHGRGTSALDANSTREWTTGVDGG